MWNQWGQQLFSSGEAAKERLASALERTGDILTEKATAHVAASNRRQAEDQQQQQSSNVEEKTSLLNDAGAMPAGDSSKKQAEGVKSGETVSVKKEEPKPVFGWGSIMEAAKNVAEVTQTAVQQQQKHLNEMFHKGPYHRKLSLPLDVDALKDAEVVYVTDRLITMGHPAMQSSTDGDITPYRKLAAVGHLMQKRHCGKFMVWNLSEVEYDYSILDDQVLSFQFPGSPAPPLGLMLKLLLSIESWLKADPKNVAVIHCLTGKGRTSTVLAAFLCWTGEAGFHDPMPALEYIAQCKRCDVEALTIPSQRRYAGYFANMFEGVRPNQPPLLLKRIVMSEAPTFGRCPTFTTDNKYDPDDAELGCSPYLQIFKGGHLVFTTTASTSQEVSKDTIPFCPKSDGPVCFPIDVIVQGDILIRCRHLTMRGQRVSMFRAAFHTGYVPPKVLRLSKAQLDGACTDKRFASDSFLDLIFEPCDSTVAGKHLFSQSSSTNMQGDDSTEESNKDKKTTDDESLPSQPETKEDIAKNEAKERRMRGTVSHNKNIPDVDLGTKAYTYDSMLHRDSRFWEVITKRREENLDKPTDKDNVLVGPTVGRRREFASPTSEENPDNADAKSDKGEEDVSETRVIQETLNFSIGVAPDDAMGFMEFFHDEKRGQSDPSADDAKPEKATTQPKRDELMEALMAIEHDSRELDKDDVDEDDEQEIVFSVDTDTPKETPTPPTASQKSTEAVVENQSQSQGSDIDQTKKEKEPESDGRGFPFSEEADLYVADSTDFEEIDDYDLDLDDDEELQDLEDFLTKGTK